MATLFGMDLGGMIDGVGGAVSGLLDGMQGGESAPPRDQFANVQSQQRDPFARLSYGRFDPLAKVGGGFKDPFAGVQYRGYDPLAKVGGSAFDPLGAMDSFNPRDVFATFQNALSNQAQSKAQNPVNGPGTATQTGALVPGGPNMDFSGPATADDNQGITGAQIDQFVASKFRDSPLVGSGEAIIQIANKYGVSVPLLLGIAWKESGMGTNVGIGNIFGLTDPTRDGGLGGQRAFQQFGNPLQEVEAAAKNLSGGTYRGKSAADQISMWYVGSPYATSANSDDKAGNGTVNDYLNNFIAPTYAAFGKGFNATQTPRQRQPAAGGNVAISPEGFTFPVANWGGGSVPLHWGSEHGGADIFAPEGASVVAMGNGTVIDAGTNSLGGNTVTMRLDNGLIVYMAHLRDLPLVAAGQRVQAGAQLGFVGDTGNAKGTGAHLHLGVGRDIVNGGGPTGGLGDGFGSDGNPFDANAWLNSILNQTRARR